MQLKAPPTKRLLSAALVALVASLLVLPVPGSTTTPSRRGATAAQTPLSVVHKRDLKFGDWASTLKTGGTVTMSPNSNTTTVVGPLVSFGGIVHRARVQLIGESMAYVMVTLPSSITIEQGTSGHVMTVDNFQMDTTNPVRLNIAGKKVINISATLHVSADQRKGNYRHQNSFTVSALYE